jgi:hypothetical protein
MLLPAGAAGVAGRGVVDGGACCWPQKIAISQAWAKE